MVLVLYDFGYVTRMTGLPWPSHDDPLHPHRGAEPALQEVILKHALRDALIAPFTVIMLQINWLLSGVIVVEYFFAYKGFGACFSRRRSIRTYLIEACTMVAVFVAMMTQTIADVGYTSNPRIRFS